MRQRSATTTIPSDIVNHHMGGSFRSMEVLVRSNGVRLSLLVTTPETAVALGDYRNYRNWAGVHYPYPHRPPDGSWRWGVPWKRPLQILPGMRVRLNYDTADGEPSAELASGARFDDNMFLPNGGVQAVPVRITCGTTYGPAVVRALIRSTRPIFKHGDTSSA